jgi:hypothetical protein
MICIIIFCNIVVYNYITQVEDTGAEPVAEAALLAAAAELAHYEPARKAVCVGEREERERRERGESERGRERYRYFACVRARAHVYN